MIGPKSKQFIKVDYPQPVDTLLSLIEVMKDPKTFNKHLKAIKEYTEKANKAVETLGKAEEIERLLTDAKIKQKQASDLAEEKTSAALKIVSEAEEKAQYLTAQAREAAQEILSHADEANKKAIQREKDSQTRQTELKTLQAQLDAANQAQQKREADLNKWQAEIDKRKAILAQL